jgi:acyl-CoA synthetase (AMP-forming)/AMP-acid ligase II
MLDLLPASACLEDINSGRALDRTGLIEASLVRSDALRQIGLKAGERLGICHRDSFSLLIDAFAAWQLGATVVPLSASLTALERRRAAEKYRFAAWVADQPLADVPSLSPTDQAPAPVNKHHHTRPSPATLDDAALILSTSGTTTEPKGVVLSRRALLARIALNIERIGANALRRALVPLPLHFGHGLIGNALTPLLSGGTVLLWTEPAIDALAGFGPLLDQKSVTFVSSVPAMWRLVLRLSPAPSGSALVRIHVGSEPLPTDLWRAIAKWSGDRPVYNMYGISEAANWICGEDGAKCNFSTGVVGTPWGGAMRVIEGETNVLSDRGRGEIVVATPGLMTGYWMDEAGTTKALDGSWLRTGDVGEIGEDGRLRVVGRTKYQINRGGIKISAEEIDALLRNHEDVEDACAFAMPDAVAGEVVAAVVVARGGKTVDLAALKTWCAHQIRAEAVPHAIAQVESIPRSERGKIQRDKTRDIYLAGKSATT